VISSVKIHHQLLPPAAKNPFEKGFLDLPKLFDWDGLDTVFFFVSLRVTSWLKISGGFWSTRGLDNYYHVYYHKDSIGMHGEMEVRNGS